MINFIIAHQLNIMLGLAYVCFVCGLFGFFAKSLPKGKKIAVINLEFSSCILLISDRLSDLVSGDTSAFGFYAMRISTFLVFFMTISCVNAFNLYTIDLCKTELMLKQTPIRLRIVKFLCLLGWLLAIVTQFTNLYYSFNSNNEYQRETFFLISYIAPFVSMLLQLSVVIQYFKKISKNIAIPMILFIITPLAAAVIQAKFYGLLIVNIAIALLSIVVYLFSLIEENQKFVQANKLELEKSKEVNTLAMKSFKEIATAFASAIDNNNKYTKNHSKRVAEYSSQIAEKLGMNENERYEVYCSAVLHDIGKIYSTSSETFDENFEIKDASKILKDVEAFPFLKIAAIYHEEHFDGSGPFNLAGKNIPLIARIVAVANKYDELTSFKPSREPLAQGEVRETILEMSEKAFDPEIVKVMIKLIDEDTEYVMREFDEDVLDETIASDLTKVDRIHFNEYKDLVSDGIQIQTEALKINFKYEKDAAFRSSHAMPAIILFDSFDRCVHKKERLIKNLHYIEFGEIWFDGHTICTQARNIKTNITQKDVAPPEEDKPIDYKIEMVRIKDHVRIKIDNDYQLVDVIVALPDSGRFVFASFSGEHCTLKNINIVQTEFKPPKNYIERRAPEVNYFNYKNGDIKNVQIDGYREAYSESVLIENGLTLSFSTQSMPIANLVHHCPSAVLFTSEDGNINGKDAKEYACICFDGSDKTIPEDVVNRLSVHKTKEFTGWDNWKELNKKGYDCEITFERKKNKIITRTENGGIRIECITIVPPETNAVYVALSGDLCSLMNIRIL